ASPRFPVPSKVHEVAMVAVTRVDLPQSWKNGIAILIDRVGLVGVFELLASSKEATLSFPARITKTKSP
ncbi:hypothetical protein, partial [Bradyrhizobium sp.]|uniref:hypothetical protein n=2 Tax=Nitrobacteraceae TaxID=41294 RepID=UPI00290F4D5E